MNQLSFLIHQTDITKLKNEFDNTKDLIMVEKYPRVMANLKNEN